MNTLTGLMRPHAFRAAAVLSIASLLLPSCSDGESSADAGRSKRPNILFITVDDMGWDSVGAYGSTVPGVTPNIDGLAAEGIRFEHAHVNVAVCQPSRAVLLTGLYPHRNGARGFERIQANVPTLFERLKTAGYRVGILGKVEHSAPSRRAAWDFVVSDEALNAGRDSESFYEHARRFVSEARESGQPFFLVANVGDPHMPFANTMAERSLAKMRASGFSRPVPPVSRQYTPQEIRVPGFLPDLPVVRGELAAYFTSVHRADESVGKILEAIAAENLVDETLTTLVSDNGMHFPFAKTNVYMSSTRTPWIVRWPGVVAAGSEDANHFISAVDFAPTILDAVGLPPLERADGRSFLPLLTGNSQEGREYVFSFFFETVANRAYPMRSVQSAHYGYIFNAWSDGISTFTNRTEKGVAMRAMVEAAKSDEALARRLDFLRHRSPEEFYDYEKDPDALRNLIESPEMMAEVKKYRDLLAANMKATGDPLYPRFSIQIAEDRK